MSRPPKSAAVVELTRETRTEFVVVYYSDDWEDLPKLLEAPVEFLRGQQFLWEQEAGSSIPWQLLSPLSAILEYGYGSVGNVFKALSYLGTDILGAGEKEPGFGIAEALNFVGPQFSAFNVGPLTVETVPNMVSNLEGSFLVEFATYTNSIKVLYFPPSPQAVSGRTSPRFAGGISCPSLIRVDASNELTSSNLHFDLDQNSHRMRADFIVSHLENPHHTADLVNGLADQGLLIGDSYKITPVSPDRTSLQTQREPDAMPRDTKFFPGVLNALLRQVDENAFVRSVPDEGKATINTFLETFLSYGTVIAHNLSDPRENFVCSNTTCQGSGTPGLIGMGTMVVEAYTRVLYDSKFIVDHHRESTSSS